MFQISQENQCGSYLLYFIDGISPTVFAISITVAALTLVITAIIIIIMSSIVTLLITKRYYNKQDKTKQQRQQQQQHQWQQSEQSVALYAVPDEVESLSTIVNNPSYHVVTSDT